MPTRYLKPGIRDSETIDKLSPFAECFFYRLLVTVDDFGRYDARPAMLRSACYPIREAMTAAKCEALLKELECAGLVYVYEVDGKPCLQMRKWDNVPRAKESKYPPMQFDAIQVYANAQQGHTDAPLTGTVTETKTETKTETRSRVFFVLPDWINADHWNAWHSCPKRKKATDQQKQLAVDKLAAWKAEGVDYAAALENAAIGGWQGLFRPDTPSLTSQALRPRKGNPLTDAERDAYNAAQAKEAERLLFGGPQDSNKVFDDQQTQFLGVDGNEPE
jgi:hypothetical protein